VISYLQVSADCTEHGCWQIWNHGLVTPQPEKKQNFSFLASVSPCVHVCMHLSIYVSI
jgi:hypothetical protein